MTNLSREAHAGRTGVPPTFDTAVSDGLNAHYAQLSRERCGRPQIRTAAGLENLLQALARWRSRSLANTVVQRDGSVVQSGPFQGMTYLARATEGCLLPRLLGSYESELHPAIEGFIAADLDAIIDIGCAEGYYAVGLARRLPQTAIHAHDIAREAREACAELALLNSAGDNLHIGPEFHGADFDAFAGSKVLVLMDAEGAEDDLLDPVQWPALRGMNLIVETHNMYRPGVTLRLIARFEATHDIELIRNAPRITARPRWLEGLSHLDQLIAIWEWRAGPTPWLVMRPKSAQA